MDYQIQIREVEPQPILSIRAVVPNLELIRFFDEACREMQTYLEQLSIRVTGPAMSLWHSAPGELPDASDIETCLPIEAPVSTVGRMKYRVLQGGLEAFTIHQGSYEDMVNAFEAVWQWIKEQGYEMTGPPRDAVLVGPNDTDDPSAYRTEIVYSVAARR